MLQLTVIVIAIGCGRAKSPTVEAPAVEAPAEIVNRTEPALTCVVAVGNPAGTLTIDGVALPDFELETLRAVLGEPERVERIVSEQRYEESGEDDDDSWTSSMETVIDFHQVYEQRGLVFSTQNEAMGGDSETPDVLLVFLEHPRVFDSTEAPAVIPTGRGGCQLQINGVVVDPAVDARPPGITYRTDRFERFDTWFASTSGGGVIDRIYTVEGPGRVVLFLDGAATGRPSYAEILR